MPDHIPDLLAAVRQGDLGAAAVLADALEERGADGDVERAEGVRLELTRLKDWSAEIPLTSLSEDRQEGLREKFRDICILRILDLFQDDGSPPWDVTFLRRTER